MYVCTHMYWHEEPEVLQILMANGERFWHSFDHMGRLTGALMPMYPMFIFMLLVKTWYAGNLVATFTQHFKLGQCLFLIWEYFDGFTCCANPAYLVWFMIQNTKARKKKKNDLGSKSDKYEGSCLPLSINGCSWNCSLFSVPDVPNLFTFLHLFFRLPVLTQVGFGSCCHPFHLGHSHSYL